MSFDHRRLKQLREQRGWSQTELAQKIGVSKQTIHEYELGRKSPSRENLSALADVFNTSVDYLMGRTNIKKMTNKKEPVDLMDALRDEELPHIDGVPIDEETAKFLYIQLRALKEKLLEEMKEKKTKKKISA